ncbi:unnamed protein product [Rotaria sp. Silwood2]|nr:unnamed protein product [Rotaria sp. Silwood2]CAF4249998.1 unnamed protein product [Rotaria sp. Silwood2]
MKKRIELLRKQFSVYEAEGIQCQLTFQNRTTTLSSTECSSCALKHERNQVCLYIHKDIFTLDYIDIGTELTRFVCKTPLDTLVYSISDKLASPLETLKRRRIPVDRLLKNPEQQPIKFSLPISQIKTEETKQIRSIQQEAQVQQNSQKKSQERIIPRQKQPLQQQEQTLEVEKLQQYYQQEFLKQINNKQEEHQQNLQLSRGLFQNLKDSKSTAASSPSSLSSRPSQSQSVENISSTIETNRIDNFGRYKSTDDANIDRTIRTTRSYSQMEFNQIEHSKTENNSSCEFVPASNMIRYDKLLHGISLYINRNVKLTDIFIDQGKQLAWLLSGLAKQVFTIPIETMHLFRDIESARIAFNSNGALFFNLRYFEQIFFDDLKLHLENSISLSSSIPIVRKIVNFYFMVACHELSHNIDSNHDLNFINRFEKISVRFMDAKDAFLLKFSFQEL